MLDIQAIHLLRSIQKTAHILLLLLMLDRPTGETEIAGILSLSTPAVRGALVSLARIGLVHRDRHKNGYTASPEARLFILGRATEKTSLVAPSSSTAINLDINITAEEEADSTANNSPVGGNLTAEKRFNGPCVGEIVDKPVDNSPKVVDKIEFKAGNGRWQKKSAQNSYASDPRDSPQEAIDPDLVQALREAGIGLNPRTYELARLPHMTAEYVRRHHAGLVKRKKGHAAGLLVTILEGGEPPYEDDPLHPTGCSCRNCRSKYKDWLKPSREFDGG
jgi:hypothetical protein